MIQQAIAKIVDKQDLSYDEAYAVMSEIMNGETTQTQNAAFLAVLSTKSTKAETIDEISGCAAAMRERAIPVAHPGMEVLEIVGTGGDGAHSFNISTTSALVLAGGLSPRNVADAIRLAHPFGVDTSSGIETNGRKDPAKMAAFAAAVRQFP